MPQLSGPAVVPTIGQTLLAGHLVGYGFCGVLGPVLAVLAWRSPGPARHARVLFATCVAAWSLGGLTRFGVVASGLVADESGLIAWLECLAFSAAAVWPISLSLLWISYPHLSRRRLAVGRWLVGISSTTAVLLVMGFVGAALGGHSGAGDRGLRWALPIEQL